MAEIKIRNVVKSFGNFQALNDINLTVSDREFMVLLGASGCGKTTLLRIVAGLENQSQGEVWIGDRCVDDLPPRARGIAMVFQNYAIFPHLTVYNNIGFGLKMHGFGETEIRRRVQKNAELMHIEHLLLRYSGELSGGQRQRVAVARALAMEPDVILMDEPLSNLDALLRLEMRAELKGVLAESRTTTIYVTHDQVEAMSLADKISVMDGGNIVQSSRPIEIYRNPATSFVAGFIGNPPMNFLPARKLSEGLWEVAGIQFRGPATVHKTLVFAIRPEDIRVGTKGLGAVVRLIEPLGAHLLVTCDIDGKMFRAILDSDQHVKAGDKLFLEALVDRVRWFDPETNMAVKG